MHAQPAPQVMRMHVLNPGSVSGEEKKDDRVSHRQFVFLCILFALSLEPMPPKIDGRALDLTEYLLLVERLPHFFVSLGTSFQIGHTSTSPLAHNAGRRFC